MARKSRIVLANSYYHIVARTVNRAMVFKDDHIKDMIAETIISVAKFSGVELISWCVMDNHIHVFVNVPSVPECYWNNSDVEPDTNAFTLRPALYNLPRWSPENSNNGVLSADELRPPTNFTLPDEEMVNRLAALRHWNKFERNKYLERWTYLRSIGCGFKVDDEKDGYCRRMYNVSQFAKTIKESIAMKLNRMTGRKGILWDGRFYSGIVEDTTLVKSIVAAYIDYNPVKAGIAQGAEDYRWSSYSRAVHGDVECRKAYEKLYSLDWDECRVKMERIFAEKIDSKKTLSEIINELPDSEKSVTPEQAIHVKLDAFVKAAVICSSAAFIDKVRSTIKKGFKYTSLASSHGCYRLIRWRNAA